MHVYKSLTKPTVVSHSLTCNFTGDEDNLVIVKGNSLLQIFRITFVTSEIVTSTPDAEESELITETGDDTFIGTEINLQTANERMLYKLVLVHEVPLDGYVTDIGSFRSTAYPNRDVLVLSFKYAKMILLLWDDATHQTMPISVHYYEKNLFDGHFVDPDYDSRFKTDPLNNCLCLMYQKDVMAFLPFFRDETLDEAVTGKGNSEDQPIYSPSFVVPVSRLDETISHVVDFAFLYEYREPTIAILFQPVRTWSGTLPLHKDTVRYIVMSLDTQQRSSTVITSVSKLPYDIDQILPLPSPLGGSLLIGANNIIHIDTSGKAKGVAVNKASELITDMMLEDQMDLQLRLEGCKVTYLKECGQVLVVLEDGRLFTLKFFMEGRKIHGLSLSPIAPLENRTKGLVPNPSTLSAIGNRIVFIGSSTSDAHLLSWKIKGEQLQPADGKLALNTDAEGKDKAVSDDLDDLDDDIYGAAKRYNGDLAGSSATGHSEKDLQFVVNDTINNIGPINNICIGRGECGIRDAVYDVVAATGCGPSGGVCIFEKCVRPNLLTKLKLGSYNKIWTFASNSLVGETMGGEELSIFDTHIITSDSEGTKLYRIGEAFEEIQKTDFRLEVPTREVFVALNGTVIVQILEKQVILYTSDFSKLDVVKLETVPISVKFQDPYLLVTTKKSYTIYQLDYVKGKSSLRALNLPAHLSKTFVTSSLGSSSILNGIAQPKKGVKRRRGKQVGAERTVSTAPVPVGALVSKEGDLELFQIGNPDIRITLRGLANLSSTVQSTVDTTQSTATRVQITDLILAPLGDANSQEEYVIFLTSTNELYLYKIFIYQGEPRLTKVTNIFYSADLRSTYQKKEPPKTEDGGKKSAPPKTLPKLHVCELLGLYKSVVISGERPAMIISGSRTSPVIHRLTHEPIKTFTSFNTESVYRGFAYLDENNRTNLCTLRDNVDYESPLPVRRISIGESVTNIAYHSKSDVYLLATCRTIPYDAVDEDEHPIPGLIEGIPKSTSLVSSLKLISPMTWTVIDEVELEKNEVIMCLKTMLLEVSEKSKRRNEVIAFGTSCLRGEDLASKGTFYIYDAIDIVPEPGKPETNRKLKELAKESMKGAITAICEVSGYLLIGQGQKVVVRNLQEDNSIIPVAFCDLSMYISEAKSIKNLLILGDALRSIWLVGFALEPYRMTVIAKDFEPIKVLSSEFVTNNGRLYMVVGDADRILYLFQYDPDDPSSSGGQKLVKKSHFYVGKQLRTMILAKLKIDGPSELIPLCGAGDGSLSIVLPLSESSYRTLFVMQEQIIDKEEHNACLNPRMYRALGSAMSQEQVMSRFLLDYSILGRFPTLSVQKKYNYSRKLGRDAEAQVWDCLGELDKALDYL